MGEEQVSRIITRLKMFPNLSSALTTLDDDVIKEFASDALAQAKEDGFTDENIVRGATYLAAHFCNMANNTSSNISKQQASVLSIEYFDRGGSDDFLAEYKRLKNSLTRNAIRFM